MADEKQDTLKNINKALSVTERRFAKAYLSGKTRTIGEAYIRAGLLGKAKPENASVLGHAILKRIKAKVDFKMLLEAADLGDDRLVREMNKGLAAKKVELYQGEVVGEFDDNTIQQRSRELLARIRQRDHGETEASVNANVTVHFYIPKNGREASD